MRPSDDKDVPIFSDTTSRLSALSIVIDDFDSEKNSSKEDESVESSHQPAPRPYSRQSSDASIRKILEEAEHRKHEFWKLIEEYDAVIEKLKRIEQLEKNVVCKLPSVIKS